MRRFLIALSATALLLAACGQTTEQRQQAEAGASVIGSNDPNVLLGAWEVTPVGYRDVATLQLEADGSLIFHDWCHGHWAGDWQVAGSSALELQFTSSVGSDPSGPCREPAPHWFLESQNYELVSPDEVRLRDSHNYTTATMVRTGENHGATVPDSWVPRPDLPSGFTGVRERTLRSHDWLIEGVPVTFHPPTGHRGWITGDCIANTGTWSLYENGEFAPLPATIIPMIACTGTLDRDGTDDIIANTRRVGIDRQDKTLALISADGSYVLAQRA